MCKSDRARRRRTRNDECVGVRSFPLLCLCELHILTSQRMINMLKPSDAGSENVSMHVFLSEQQWTIESCGGIELHMLCLRTL